MSQPPYPPRGPFPGQQPPRPQRFPGPAGPPYQQPGYRPGGHLPQGPRQGMAQGGFPPPRGQAGWGPPGGPPQQFQAQPPRRRRRWPLLVGIPLLAVALVVGYFAYLEISHNIERDAGDQAMVEVVDELMTAYVSGDYDTLMPMVVPADSDETWMLTPEQLAKALEGLDASYSVIDAWGSDSLGSADVELTLGGQSEELQLYFDKQDEKWTVSNFLIFWGAMPKTEVNGFAVVEPESYAFPGRYAFAAPTVPEVHLSPASAVEQVVFPDASTEHLSVYPSPAIAQELADRFRARLADCEGKDQDYVAVACAWGGTSGSMQPGSVFELSGEFPYERLKDPSSWSLIESDGAWVYSRFVFYEVLVTGTSVSGEVYDRKPLNEGTYIDLKIDASGHTIEVY